MRHDSAICLAIAILVLLGAACSNDAGPTQRNSKVQSPKIEEPISAETVRPSDMEKDAADFSKSISGSLQAAAVGPQLLTDAYGDVPESSTDKFTYPDYPDSGVHIGQGWDSFSSRGTAATCVNAEEVPLELRSFRTDAQEVKSSLSIFKSNSLAIAASYSGFGASGSVNFNRDQSFALDVDKFHFLFEFESQASSTYALPSGTVATRLTSSDFKELLSKSNNDAIQQRMIDIFADVPQYTGSMFKLTAEASELLEGDLESFTRMCGQGFVSAIYRGSKLRVVVSSASTKQEEKEKLRLQLSAKGYGARLSVSSTQVEDQKSLDERISAQVHQEGGFPIAPPRSFAELEAVFQNADALLDRPNAYKVRVTSYEDLLQPRSDWAKPLPEELKELTEYYLAIKDIHNFAMDAYDRIVETSGTGVSQADSAYVTLLADAYSHTSNGAGYMRDLVDEISMHRSFVEKVIRACYRNLTRCGDFNAVLAIVAADISRTHQDRLNVSRSVLVSEIKDDLRMLILNELPATPELKPDASDALTKLSIRLEAFPSALKDESLENIVSLFLENDVMTLTDEFRELLEVSRDLAREADVRYQRFADAASFYNTINTASQLREAFYPRIYGFLARVPISESDYQLRQVTSLKVTSRSWKHGKYRKTETAYVTTGALNDQQNAIMSDPEGVLQDILIVRRLLPWARYFCRESVSHSLCVAMAQLEDYAQIDIDEERIKGLLAGNLNYRSVEYKYRKDRRGGIYRL